MNPRPAALPTAADLEASGSLLPLRALEAALAQSWPPQVWQEVSIVVAVSGGADSVALLRALARLKTAGSGRLWVAHLNHTLRGQESDADEQFVAALAQQLGLGLRVGRLSPGELAGAGRDGLEAAARSARYAFLQSAAEEVGARYLITAHTADDQAETVLQRILRGTAMAGLAGIRRTRALTPALTLLRPLLAQRRTELRAYLTEIGQPWREDATNATCDATRTWIRNELLPLVEGRINPAAGQALLRVSLLAGETQALVQELAAELAERTLSTDQVGNLMIACDALAGERRLLVREMLVLAWRERGWPEQNMGFDEWELLAEQVLRPPHLDTWQRDLPGNVRAQKKGARLTLARLVKID